MICGRGGMGSHKHGISGHSPKSPKLRHNIKLEAERSEVKDRSRIKDPKASVSELFNRRKNETRRSKHADKGSA